MLECNQPDYAQLDDPGISRDIVGFDFHDQIEVSTAEEEYLAGNRELDAGQDS
jgi:hypothetical protein